jgi:hypothetical protein
MDIDFGFIGWNKDEANNHDKVWGYFYRPTPNASRWMSKDDGWNCCIFWARRGKAMQFKAGVTGYDLKKLVRSKKDKGYQIINKDQFYQIWPSFEQEALTKLSFEVLVGNIK